MTVFSNLPAFSAPTVTRIAFLVWAFAAPARAAILDLANDPATGGPGKFASEEIRREAAAKGMTLGNDANAHRVVLSVEKVAGAAAESYRIRVQTEAGRSIITVLGADEALSLLNTFSKVSDKELRLTLGDIRAMSHLGNYYGHKIRGATELALYRKTKAKSHQETAIQELTSAAHEWERYIATAQAQYLNPIRLNRTGVCDWKALTTEVWHDVEIARSSAKR